MLGRHIKNAAILVSFAIGLTAPGFGAETGDVSMKFAGEKDWSVTCSFNKDNGKTRDVRRKGKGFSSIESIAKRNIASGACTIYVPEGTSLKVSFTSNGAIACPFEDKDSCIAIFTGSGETSFTF
jgi:hypothetical protein